MSVYNLPESASSASILLLSHSSEESQAAVSAFPSAKLTLLPHDKHADILSLPASSFQYVLSSPSLPFSPPFLQQVLARLSPAGEFISTYPIDAAVQDADMILSGFVDVTSSSANGRKIVRAVKPSSIAAAPLKFKKKTTTAAPSQATKSVWSLAANDTNDLDAELVGEDDLLSKDKVTLPVRTAEMDCGTGSGPTKKACKNCSCGLAEVQAAEANGTASSLPAKPVSACGSCGLGDAFRCASCPYLGQPAFATAPSGAVKLAL